MDLNSLIALPIIAAFIGWLTNYVAVKMLFRPKLPVRFLFFTIQGVFPKRQEVFAQKLGGIVANELFSAEDIKSGLIKATQDGTFNQIIKSKIEHVLLEKLPKEFPMLQMFLTPELIAKVSGSFESEISGMVGIFIDKLGSNIDQLIDIESVVADKVSKFSTEKLEEMLFAIMKREFKFIEFVGGVLGFLIGLIQIALIKWVYIAEYLHNLMLSISFFFKNL